MAYDFDAPPDRRGTESVKWRRYAGRDVLPMWVADMDFAAPPEVIDSLARRVAHGVFGYGEPGPSLVEAVLEHLEGEYGWRVDPAWIVWLPGVVSGLHAVCRAIADRPGGSAFTATPIYPPFLGAAARMATAPLVQEGGRWRFDLAAVEAALPADARLLLLCHPHNPVGRAWDEAELGALDELAARRGLVVCSDEIHAGLVLDVGLRHRPFAARSPEAARRSITLMSPSKTFNVPGLYCSWAVVPDGELRKALRGAMHGIVPHLNILGLTACEAALRHGAPWRRALLDYLRDNRAAVEAFVAATPGLAAAPVEATYLAWIDARATGLPRPQRHFEEHGVGLSDGRDFGPPGPPGAPGPYDGFVRLNFGCSRRQLDEALRRMRAALEHTGGQDRAPPDAPR